MAGELRPGACPSCGYVYDDCTGVFDAGDTPTAGAVSICIRCATISIFTGHGLEVRAATPDERSGLLRDPRVHAAVSAVLDVNDETGGHR